MTEPIKPTQEGMYNCQFHTGGCLCHFNGYQQGQSAERAKWEKLKAKLIDGREIYVKDPDCGLEAEALGWAIEKMVELEKEPT